LGLITLFNPVHSGASHSTPAINADGSWTEFKISDQSSARFGQPVVYYAGSTDLRANDINQRGPWEINPNGPININVGGEGGAGSVQLFDGNPGEAVSKAIVYYHRFSDWNEAPNLFNPYWRAKLDSFDGLAEAAIVTGAMGDASGAALVAGVGALSPGAANLKAR
jgi:hypothetical protein